MSRPDGVRLRIRSGNPDEAELAALVIALATVRSWTTGRRARMPPRLAPWHREPVHVAPAAWPARVPR